MCSIQAAMAGVQIVGKVQEYREQKALAAEKRRANAITIENANRAYIRDINKIDQEKVQADQEKAAAKIKTDMEKKKKIAQNINLNAGNRVAIVQDIGSLYNDEYNENARDYKGDMITLANQTTDAYANMAKTYNSIAPVVEPSRTGLLLDVAMTAGEGYIAHTDATSAKKDEGLVVAP